MSKLVKGNFDGNGNCGMINHNKVREFKLMRRSTSEYLNFCSGNI